MDLAAFAVAFWDNGFDHVGNRHGFRAYIYGPIGPGCLISKHWEVTSRYMA